MTTSHAGRGNEVSNGRKVVNRLHGGGLRERARKETTQRKAKGRTRKAKRETTRAKKENKRVKSVKWTTTLKKKNGIGRRKKLPTTSLMSLGVNNGTTMVGMTTTRAGMKNHGVKLHRSRNRPRLLERQWLLDQLLDRMKAMSKASQ